MKTCEYCDADCSVHWNLAPIDILPDRSDYVYDGEMVVCDECYDGHCTKYNIGSIR